MAAFCGLQTSLKFDSTSSSSSTSTRVFPFQALKWTQTRSTTRIQFTFPHFPPLSTARNAAGARCSPLACSRRAHQGEDAVSTSEDKRISAPYDGLSKVAASHNCTSAGNPEEITKDTETYISSVRTVALWVCTAVIFGVGLGFKDGVGKASEFFAGYEGAYPMWHNCKHYQF